jgi:hypothetical protein
LSDNGGEFVNEEMIDLAEKYNITLKTTAAESPWSNGLCERHNGILNDNVNKVMESGNFSLETAIHWAVSAKNSLANVYGFSPNVLVFGRNPNFPNAFINKLPANNSTCLSSYVAENLNAMHLARATFIKQEAAERLRRALNRKSRTYSNKTFCQGDLVYYWRNNGSEWHGPAVVIGKDSQQILVKHGGMYIRVHPCRLQMYNNQNMSENQNSEHAVVPSSNDEDDYITADNREDSTTADSDEDDPNSNTGSNVTNPNDFVEQTSNNSIPNEHHISPSGVNQESTSWIHVTNKKELPKAQSTIECKFPNQSDIVQCKILSKAGKSTTANWHYLNIQESESNEGKCCSFKNVSWRPVSQVSDNDDHTSNEVFYGLCDPVFDCAKREEIEKWKLFNTFQEVPDNGEKAISTRWVCTRKIKGNEVVYKARLVARGFEEDYKSFQRDSPTCCKESLRILLTIISSRLWKLHSLDVKSAFLQGSPMQRTVYIRPPKEANCRKLWKMLRCPYGLADAGRHWYSRLKHELLELGLKICKYDQALFIWYDNDKLSGIIACHVDDLVFGGSLQFHNQVMKKLRSVFVIGSEEDTHLKYLGLTISQHSNGITVSTEAYGKSLKQLEFSTIRSSKDTVYS